MDFKKEIRLSDAVSRENSTLHCPGCGEHCLHHERVDVCDRLEDRTDGYHVLISSEGVKVDSDVVSSNPSSRRDGLTVGFWCEHCNCKPVLGLLQHKGSTYLGWVQV